MQAEPWLPALQDLHAQRGRPTTRTVARAAGLSHTTIADALAGRRGLPLPTLLKVVRALDGDERRFIELAYPHGVERPPTDRELLTLILAEVREIRAALDRLSETQRP